MGEHSAAASSPEDLPDDPVADSHRLAMDASLRLSPQSVVLEEPKRLPSRGETW